jgi:hypothetical protein
MAFRVGLTERLIDSVFVPLMRMQIKSFEKRIANLEAALMKNPEEEARILQELNTLKEKKGFLMKNPSVLGIVVPQ